MEIFCKWSNKGHKMGKFYDISLHATCKLGAIIKIFITRLLRFGAIIKFWDKIYTPVARSKVQKFSISRLIHKKDIEGRDLDLVSPICVLYQDRSSIWEQKINLVHPNINILFKNFFIWNLIFCRSWWKKISKENLPEMSWLQEWLLPKSRRLRKPKEGKQNIEI